MKNSFKFGFAALAISLSITACGSNKTAETTTETAVEATTSSAVDTTGATTIGTTTTTTEATTTEEAPKN